MTIGVFGGSYNPVHNGHMAVAHGAVASGEVDRVLMTLSPLNPLKADPSALLPDHHRLAMLTLACGACGGGDVEPCDIELSMPRPSYTIDTLRELQRRHPGDRFRLIIGADNWAIFHRWRAWQEILRDFSPLVYPREGYPMPGNGEGATALDAPLFPLSSTDIRTRIAAGEDVSRLLPPAVVNYIKEHKLYLPSSR